MINPHKLRPGELCQLVNSTPLGDVCTERQLKRWRTKAGLRIGSDRQLDLVRFVAWLVRERHKPKPAADLASGIDLARAAQGAAALGSSWKQPVGHGQRLTSRQESVIAALLTEPTYTAAAAKAGVGETTLYRWLRRPDFRAAYRRARRELVEAAIGRIQAACGQGVAALVDVACRGKRDSDRVRAAIALLDYACRGLEDADTLHGPAEESDKTPMDAAAVLALLAARLRQLDQSELPTAEKARLSVDLAGALLRAFGVDVLDKRLEALQSVLLNRKNQTK